MSQGNADFQAWMDDLKDELRHFSRYAPAFNSGVKLSAVCKQEPLDARKLCEIIALTPPIVPHLHAKRILHGEADFARAQDAADRIAQFWGERPFTSPVIEVSPYLPPGYIVLTNERYEVLGVIKP